VLGFQSYLPAVELHHENWDGTGYPLGLRGEGTPLPARIVHVADAYDAMTSDRPYRKGMSHDEAIDELHRGASAQFDPVIVRIFAQLPCVLSRSRRSAVPAEIHSLANSIGVPAAQEKPPKGQRA
jgi:HD-GYP domain-containing protein (c-di-GMP phosphodiesterase class II)